MPHQHWFCGAVAPGLKIGDVVCSTSKLAYHDVDLTAFGYDLWANTIKPLTLKVTRRNFRKRSCSGFVIPKIGLIIRVIASLQVKTRLMQLKGIFQKSWL